MPKGTHPNSLKQLKTGRSSEEALFTEARCLGKNKDDTPKHPLYLPGDAARVSYNE